MGAPVAAVLAFVGVVIVGCSPSAAPRFDVLGGAPRYPDAAGVVTDVSPEAITLDGDRRLPLADELASFSTYTLDPLPLIHRRGQYVHVGLDDGEVVWVATIGAVAALEERVVIYTGELLHVDERDRAIFSDGTVLTLADVVIPPDPGPVRVEIDPDSDRVTSITPN